MYLYLGRVCKRESAWISKQCNRRGAQNLQILINVCQNIENESLLSSGNSSDEGRGEQGSEKTNLEDKDEVLIVPMTDGWQKVLLYLGKPLQSFLSTGALTDSQHKRFY